MYFCTYGGLSTYDGVKFTNYRLQDGLANELVNDIIEISPDSLLVATNAPLLNTLVRGKISVYQTSDHFYPVTNRFLKSKEGVLYAIADDGLFRLEGNRFVRISLLSDKGKDLGQNLDRITEWNQFLLINPWNLLQEETCIIYDKKNQKLAGVITQKRINITAVSPTGELWLSSPDGIETLDLASLQKGRIVFKPLTSHPNAAKWKNPFIYFDANNGAWLYQNNEVIHLPASGNLQTFSSAQGLKTSNLSDIFVDREGITWMASNGNGVVKMPGTNVQILNDMIPGTRNHISAISQQHDTTWMFNITDNSFYRIHDDHLTAFPLKGKPTIVNNLYIVGSQLYFIANHEIILVDNKDLANSYAHAHKIFPDTLKVMEMGTGLVDPNGFIIQNVRQDDSTFCLMIFYQEKLVLKYPLSFALDQMAIDRDGHLLIPTRDNHLFAYTLHPETPGQYLRVAYDYTREIEGMGPRSIATDSKGNIWIGTRYNGVYCMETEDNKVRSITQLTTENGLTDNFHYQLYCDPADNIWAGSQTGLDKIMIRDGEYIIENITKSKNIFQGIYKIINAGDGIIWAMTSNGEIIRVSDLPSAKKAPNPSLFITNLTVNDLEFRENDNIFRYDQNNFSITVAAPSFLDEKSIMYSYQLKGSGKNNWSHPSNNAHFNFINLAPGHYTLNVKAEFPGKIYPARQLKYSFFIRPPFWQQWWFIALAWLFILAILGLIVRLYYNRKFEKQRISLERKQAIEKERTRIATDMHDDLGAGLSRIKFLSETIGIKKQMNQPIEEEITTIRHYAHEMIDKMGEIVWALNEKNDSLSDLLSYTRAYAVEYLAENGIHSHIEKLPPFKSIMVNGEFRRNIYLSVKEALHNVIKHAKANEVHIHFQLSDKLVIHIQDDGVGIKGQFNNQYANGLSNMKKRMSEIGGNLDIITHHGTRVTLTAPLPS